MQRTCLQRRQYGFDGAWHSAAKNPQRLDWEFARPMEFGEPPRHERTQVFSEIDTSLRQTGVLIFSFWYLCSSHKPNRARAYVDAH
jgi:hypothetical protein